MALAAAHLSRSGGDSVALGTVSFFPHLLGFRSPPVPLWRIVCVQQVNQLKIGNKKRQQKFLVAVVEE